MTAQNVNYPPYALPLVDARGLLTGRWQQWFSQMYDRAGGTVDKVDQAHSTAAQAVSQATQVIAGGGLQAGGSLNGNVGLTLYVVQAVTASLPTKGNSEGDWAYALDGRKSGETTGNGTGCPVWWSTPAGVGGWYTGAGALVTT